MIYFIRRPSDGRIKIGFTDSLSTRLGNLKGELGTDLVVLGVMEGDRSREKEILIRFSLLRVEREIFEPSDNLLAFIRDECSPWDGEDPNGLKSIAGLKGSDVFEAWLDGLVEWTGSGTRSQLTRRSLRDFAINHGFSQPMPKR